MVRGTFKIESRPTSRREPYWGGESLDSKRYNVDMDRANMPVRATTLHDADGEDDDYYALLSASECVAMVWPMTLEAWRFAGEPFESRLRRDIVRVIRREG